MLGSFKKAFLVCFYTLFIIVFIVFSVENRVRVELTLFPLPYSIALPLFLFAILMLILGVTFGWLMTRFEMIKHIRFNKKSKQRIQALENELNAYRSERLIK